MAAPTAILGKCKVFLAWTNSAEPITPKTKLAIKEPKEKSSPKGLSTGGLATEFVSLIFSLSGRIFHAAIAEIPLTILLAELGNLMMDFLTLFGAEVSLKLNSALVAFVGTI